MGCGNGFTAVALARDLDVAIDAFDLSEDLIALARRQPVDGLTGTVAFAVNDLLGLDARDVYDAVYTERALQNLLGWEEQKRALEAIDRALKPGGRFIMLECFHTGLKNLNAARAEFDLEPIAEPWYNRFFVESDVIGHMAGIGCRLVEQNCCLSGYYFACGSSIRRSCPRASGRSRPRS